MAGIIVYVLGKDGEFNKNSLGAISKASQFAGENDIKYALFGGGLLGFEIGAGLTARLNWGVTAEATGIRADGGKLIVERPVLQDSAIVDVAYKGDGGVIVSRL